MAKKVSASTVTKPVNVEETPTQVVAKNPEQLPFTRMNYILLGVGIAIVALGFFLMRGPFVDATQFSVPLHVAPILVIGGFIEVIFAILYKEKKS